MIVDTVIDGRPAKACFMNEDFEPVDNQMLATMVKVIFTDAEGGVLFLTPKSHTDLKQSTGPQ